jgi:hypothetical protein
MRDIIDLIVGIASLLAVLDFFGMKPKWKWAGGTQTLPAKKWKLGLMLCLVASSLGMSSYSLFFRHPEPKFRVLSEDQLIHVQNKTFRNEVVELDGRHYDECTFINVTFVYQGTANVKFTHNHISGFGISTDDPSVSGTMATLKGLGLIRPDVPLLYKDWKPNEYINPPAEISPSTKQ